MQEPVSLPSYQSPKSSYAMFYFWVMIIGGIYLFEDALRSLLEPDRDIHRRFDLVDAGLMLLGLSFFIAHQYIPVVHGSQMFAYLFIAGTIIASVSAILLYR